MKVSLSFVIHSPKIVVSFPQDWMLKKLPCIHQSLHLKKIHLCPVEYCYSSEQLSESMNDNFINIQSCGQLTKILGECMDCIALHSRVIMHLTMSVCGSICPSLDTLVWQMMIYLHRRLKFGMKSESHWISLFNRYNEAILHECICTIN